MLRTLLPSAGRLVVAALAVGALVSSHVPLSAQAQTPSVLRMTLESSNPAWQVPSNGLLAVRVSAENIDADSPISATVSIGVPRGVQNPKVLAPKGWSCGYD